jgi:glycosyltransferase involved in cell wall biosynthesis
MTKKQNKKAATPLLPFVSICTPTFNRRPFIQTMFQCFKNQDYPKERMEWIIVDDGTDKIKDLIETSNIPQIRYFEIEKKLALGAKRNYMHKHVKGSIIVYMDDDDYYPPERVSHAVEMLQKNEKALCAGASEIYLYFKTMGKMIQAGPYGPNHATAGTFAFKTELLKDTKYNDNAALAEERAFLKDYTVPFVQLDPMKTILVFSHEHNTFDKREMFKTAHPDFFKESPKTVDMFIRRPHEQPVKDFFMRDIDALLDKYEPGLPKMKPDVLVQIEEIKKERDEIIKRETEKMQNGPILLQQGDGKPPIQLTSAQVVNIIQQLQETNTKLAQQNAELQNALIQLQRIVQNVGNVPNEHRKTTTQLSTAASPVPNKLIPDKI